MTAAGRRIEALERALSLAGARFSAADAAPARSVVEQARQRLGRSVDLTVAVLAGGTGSGKSSLFNALVGVPLSPVGVRRPSTEEPIACVWGDVSGVAGVDGSPAAALLDWIGVAPRARLSRTTSLDPRPDPELNGLVLVDLPDHDSVRTEHAGAVDRAVARADLVVWVVDPQKYADEALHGRYLTRLVGRDAALVVVMNQLDRIDPSQAATLGGDLRAVLAKDGLPDVAVLAASAATGGGLPALRALLVERVSQRRAALTRLEADLVVAARDLRAAVPEPPSPVTATEADDLLVDLRSAVAAPALVERMVLDGRQRTPVVESPNHVERAVRRLVESVFGGLPLTWRRCGEGLVDPRAVVTAVHDAVAGLDPARLGPSRLRRLVMSREKYDRERREAIDEALTHALMRAASETVLGPIVRELALWPSLLAAIDVAAG